MPGTRWLTFDCYGTIADWNTCMLGALEPVAGTHAESVLSAYHRAEAILEAGPQWRPYRDILIDGLGLAARRAGITVKPDQAGALAAAWPGMPVFPDVAEALGTLASFGWRLAILTNCDDDLFVRGGGDGRAGALLQAGPGPFPEIRGADRGDAGELDSRGQ